MATNHDLPTGTVTFLFTDIEESTLLWERHGEGMRPVLARHDALLRSAVEAHNGRVVKTTGDGLLAVFATPLAAQKASLDAQRRLRADTWQEITPDTLRVRMGLHSGEAQLRDHDYYGTTVNKAARIMDLGHGGQILLSAIVAAFLEDRLPLPLTMRDLGNHPLRGLRGFEHIYQLVAPDLSGDFPPLRSGKVLAGNLPAHVSSFVGRNREMTEIRAALPRTRLLTITGPGGTGKTRICLQVAADVQAQYEDGVWLVELAPLADPDLVVSTLAAVFNLQGQTREQAREILFDYLREKELLLILDNCEHLVEACARLAADLIAASSRLTILASSREGLGVYGESTYHLPTLNLPATTNGAAAAVGQSEAVQLFVERAAMVQPGFRLNDDNAGAVAQIVRRLDGIPLAIELAAARLNFFSTEQIATRLDDRFRLLTGGSRTALPRQQTLRALIDWSYDLLDPAEQLFFRRLSVFSGGWTFEAAESVAAPLDAFTLLPQLIAKSLVLRDVDASLDKRSGEGEAAEPRYHYLETVRQYARDRLLESGEVEKARDQHFAFYEALGEAVNFGIGPGAETFKLDWSIQEHDNLRAAIEWGTGRYPQRVIDLLWDLSILIADQIPISELIDWSSIAKQEHEALATAAGETGKQYEETQNKALVLISMLKLFQGQVHQAKSLAGEAIDLLQRDREDPVLLIMARFVKGQAGYFLEDPGLEELLEDNIADLKTLQGNPIERPMRAMVTMLSAEIAARNGKLELAQQRLAEGLALLDNTSGLFLTWAEFNRLLMLKSLDLPEDEIRRHYEAGIKTLRDNHSRRLTAMIESDWAHHLRHLGSFEEALAIYRRMLVEWQELGHRAAMANILENIAFIDRRQNRHERAVKLLAGAGRIREEIKQDMLRPEQEEFEQELAALKEKLSEQEMAVLWAEGRALGTSELIALAAEQA